MKTRVVAAVKEVKGKKNRPSSGKKVPMKNKKSLSSRKSKAREREINELILGHRENGRKLARSILRRWRVRLTTDDIDSVVDLALCEAAERYSPDKGASFMTFLFYHLRGHLVRTVSRAAQASQLFLAFARSSGVDTSQWQTEVTETSWSIAPDHFMFGQKEGATPEGEFLKKEKIEACRAAIAKLDILEQEIVMRSFGDEEALVDVARSLGYSRCHISRVKKSALDRLKFFLCEGAEAQAEGAPEGLTGEGTSETLALEMPARVERTRRRSRRRSVSSSRDVRKSLRRERGPKSKAA